MPLHLSLLSGTDLSVMVMKQISLNADQRGKAAAATIKLSQLLAVNVYT